MSMDYEKLENAIYSVLDESIADKYDVKTILLSAQYCWAGTGIQVKANDFTIVVDSLTYDVLDYTGYDA